MVERVFLAEERQRRGEIARPAALGHPANVAARTKGAIAGALQHDAPHAVVRLKIVERRHERPNHVKVQGVERPRAIEKNKTGFAAPLNCDLRYPRHE